VLSDYGEFSSNLSSRRTPGFQFQKRLHGGGHGLRDGRFHLPEQLRVGFRRRGLPGVKPPPERRPPAPEWLVIPPTARGGSDKPTIQPWRKPRLKL
jgi:hypothetical protein